MFLFTENQRKRIAGSIRRELDGKFSGRGGRQRFADLVGVSPSTVSRWANGKRTPGVEQLVRLASVFAISLHRLCGHSGKHPVRTKSMAYNNVMNLSIVMERSVNGDGATRAAMEKAEKILAGLVNGR